MYTNIEIEEQGDGWVVSQASNGIIIGVYSTWEQAWAVATAIDAELGVPQ
jgi:hypothetical protein